ncbi:MAG: ATP-binding cassette domain-containing protein [Candidatus Helarchaeota archaeon]
MTKRALIQKEILEIVSNFGFWMMKKEGLEGCAGFINTPQRKIYLEVLFPEDYPDQPIILNMPRDLRQHSALFEFIPNLIEQTRHQLMKAAEVLKALKAKIAAIPADELKERLLDELDEELNLVKSIYNVKIVEGKKYHIRISYQLDSNVNFEVEINYKDYPKKPQIIYHQGLEKIIGSPQSLQIMGQWNTSNPPHIVQIVQEIEYRFTLSQGIDDSQKLINIKNLTLVNEQNQILTHQLSLSILKGDLIGVYCLNQKIPLALFNAFLGKSNILEGEITIFGKGLKEIDFDRIVFLKFENIGEGRPSNGEKIVENVLISRAPVKISKSEARKRVDRLLSIIGLSNRRKMRMEDLGEGEQRRVIIASYCMKLPNMLLLFEPDKGLNATEMTRIWDTIIRINDEYSITTLIYSISDAISKCHNILVLSREGKQLGFGTLQQLIGELPIMREVIVIQLNEPNPEDVRTLGQIPGLTFIIEEREGEKYRLFTKIDPNRIIPQIFEKIGTNIYNIGKEKPSLIDYVPYKRVQERKG